MAIPVFIIMIILLVIVGFLVLVVALKNKKEKAKQVDYKAFYIMGVSFLPLGIALFLTTDNPGMLGLTAIGAVYMSIGLSNKDKWNKKPRKRKK